MSSVNMLLVGARVRKKFPLLILVFALLSGGAACSPPSDAPEPGVAANAVAEPPLSLPLIGWEGGPEYWKQFARANAAGWSDPEFFPIVVWHSGISNDEEVQFDKQIGINTYIGMADTTPYSLIEDNGMFWIGGKLNETFTAESRNWVGYFLDDEVDGRFPPDEGREHLRKLTDAVPAGYFKYANFTQMVIGKDMAQPDANSYVNDFTDAVSVDMYWYTIPYCDKRPYRDVYLVPVAEKYCRTASSYGKTTEALRLRDGADRKRQPTWQFVENLNGGPAEGPFEGYVSPDELRGSVMSSIINEARGILYFNQSLSGPCQSGNVFREAQVTENFCGADQVAAAQEVNTKIHELAPVINTQSYQYSFGTGLDTMLKTHGGYAYIFAMVDGDADPGSRTFLLPGQISASSVEVLFEDRSVSVGSDNKFSDTFNSENTYHIYKVKL
ncbi:hypothetical protein [Crystallibacter degradans]|uniref:hypothetical protein n=1 Tax=Crystallibacter degradans TaxID=2726743 RepID=UPI0014745D87|nr:hypothetical protein [Arthrobacter sp. SF27]NMR28213.1 hypothetical protein [Arthrobacter sp. SF27]